MRLPKATYSCGLGLLILLSATSGRAARENPNHQKHHHHYKLLDMGTLGGPNSGVPGFPPAPHILNNDGVVVGAADTSTPDPYYPNCFTDCFVSHAVQWRGGIGTDLGALPGPNGSSSQWISGSGLVVGTSENGAKDPLTGFPETNAVLWKDDQIIDLGTLGGGASVSAAVNNLGQVVGAALNTVADSFSATFILGNYLTTEFPGATQERAFLWDNGTMMDLGTLGGPDSAAGYINERGQIAGESYTNSTVNRVTGAPTLDPFLWVPCDDREDDSDKSAANNGRMLDLGTLGGTYGYPNWLNNKGQVVGQSNLAGDLTFHPFLWGRGIMNDLGTLGGNTGAAFRVNELGEVVGYADLPNSPPDCKGLACIHHAFLWKHGEMTDLGTVSPDPCSRAQSVNSSGQIVGASIAVCGGAFTHAFLWENGGPAVDLNALVPSRSGLQLIDAVEINDRGEIAGLAVLADGDEHVFLLTPCEEEHSEDCENSPPSTAKPVRDDTAPSRQVMTKRGNEAAAKGIYHLSDH